MKVKRTSNASVDQGVIVEFGQGIIHVDSIELLADYDEKKRFLIITDNIISETLGTTHYTVKWMENDWVELKSLDSVAVKMNQKKTQALRNEVQKRMEEAGVIEKAMLDETSGLAGEDAFWRMLDRLPNHREMTLSALDEEPPEKFVCHVCGQEILTPGYKKLAERRMMNCIVADQLSLGVQKCEYGRRKPDLLSCCSTNSVLSVMLFLDEAGAREAFERVMNKHCVENHSGGILHHFAPPRMLKHVWAWEFTVSWVAQVLLEESLLKVGLDIDVVRRLVFSMNGGDDALLRAQLCAVVGGAICVDGDFDQRLIGSNYDGLYLPSKVDGTGFLSKQSLRKVRNEARRQVVSMARDWLRDSLLPELATFDYSTLVTAFANTKRGDKVAWQHYPGYIWNAFGLFFRRGVVHSLDFPPAYECMRHDNLKFSMWEAFVTEYEEQCKKQQKIRLHEEVTSE